MKRLMDVVVSAVLIAVFSPLMLLAAIGIKLSSRGPILFRQQRAGLHGQPFDVFKFRSMSMDPPKTHDTSRDDPRIFPVGKVLREFHIDEVPQFFNVLKGDMSLVGPRPTLMSQVERYTERERGRLSVRPGVTGLAQVSGNNALTWSERIEIDLEYVKRAGLLLDLRILLRTVLTVLRKEGLYDNEGRVRDRL